MNKYRFYKNDENFMKTYMNTIGAHKIPIILGLSKFTTPYMLWLIMIGREKPFEGNTATDWGHLHEPNVLYRYIKEVQDEEMAYQFKLDYIKNEKIRPQNYVPLTKYFPFTEFYHPNLKFAMTHPDTVDMENKINIEAKSGKYHANIKRDDMDGYTPDDPKGYPLSVYVQVQWQMFCSGLKETVLRALIDTNTELTYNIPANTRIQEKLAEVASRFRWHVKNGIEPQPTNSNDIKKLFPSVHEKTDYLIGVKSELALKMKDRKKFLNDKIKKFKSEVEDINDAMFLFVGDSKYLYSEDNQKLCTQVRFISEKMKGVKDIKAEDMNLYLDLKERGLIYDTETRYIR